MIGIELVETIIRYVTYSGYLKENRPLSLMLVAASGAGKSDCLLQYKLNSNLFVLNDMTRYGLWQKFRESKGKNSFVTHCVIPDFSQVMMQNPFYTGAICSTMMSLMEEGTDSVMTKNIQYNIPNTRLGFMTSMAKDDFEVKQKDSRSVLVKTGFLSRFVLFSYQYRTATAIAVAKAISEGREPEPINLDLPVSRVDVHVEPKQVLEFFPGTAVQEVQESLNDEWGDPLPKKGQADVNLVPRRVKQTRTLLKSVALSNGRRDVTDEDVKEVRRLQQWINTQFKPL
jgi:hypothetical protein